MTKVCVKIFKQDGEILGVAVNLKQKRFGIFSKQWSESWIDDVAWRVEEIEKVKSI